MIRAVTTLVLLILSASVAQSRTWYVKADRTGDVPTIQAGVDSAAVGDTVLVAPGTYRWSAQGTGTEFGMITVLRGRDRFVLRSEAGPKATVLDAEYNGRVIFIQGWNYITIEGFTIQRGMAPPFAYYAGGGIVAHLSYDVIRNCIFRENIASFGGAIWCGGVSAMQIIDCQFTNNEAVNGGAVYFINSSQTPTIRNSVFHSNTASGTGGALQAVHNGFNLEGCVIGLNSAGTQGGAIFAREVWPSTIVSCTIAENTAPDGSAIHLNKSPSVLLERSIVAFCYGGPAFSSVNASVLTAACSDIFGNPSNVLPPGWIDLGSNFSADPLFCGLPGSINYSLSGISPCAPGHHPGGWACGQIGAVPPACGGVATKPVTWGALKALYR